MRFAAYAIAPVVICLLVCATLAEAQQQTWSLTGPIGKARLWGHTATLLANGNVLVAGGTVYEVKNSSFVAVPEYRTDLYDSLSGQWSATGNLNTRRSDHLAVRLTTGKVLIVGGWQGTTPLSSAELYDPASGIWSATGSLSVARGFATATLLADGRVLVAGGVDSYGLSAELATAELYDPATGAWSPTGSMNSPRQSPSATLLPGGKVLVAGGLYEWPRPNDIAPKPGAVLRSAEIYDPATGNWTATGSLVTPRVVHSATLMNNGKVLVTGGGREEYPFDHHNGVDKTEMYDPATGQWSAAANLNVPRFGHAATLLSNGGVLVSGGGDGDVAPDNAEIFDPVSGNWSSSPALKAAHWGLTATLLANGTVLVTGGPTAQTELFDPALATPIVSMSSAAYCTADPFSITVVHAAPQSSIRLSGAKDGVPWKLDPLGDTDANGDFRASATIGADIVGSHTFTAEVGGVRSIPVSFVVSNCQR